MPDQTLSTLRAKLESERVRLLQTVATFTPEQLAATVQGGWSGQDLLAHVAFAEGVNIKFARAMLSQEHPLQVETLAADFPDYPGPFALDDFNAYMEPRLRAQTLAATLDGLGAVRAETLAWLDTLTPDDLERGGMHAAWGETTVRGILRIVALHDKMHRDELARRLAA